MLKNILEKLSQLLDLMLEEREARKLEREEREQEKRDKELVAYAKANMRKDPGQIISNINDSEQLVHTKANIAIPYGLSEDERTILEDFYRDDK
jgi:hypothetical protein